MTALSQALGLNIDIAYLDGRSADGAVEFVRFRNAPDEGEKAMVLLYRCVSGTFSVYFCLGWAARGCTRGRPCADALGPGHARMHSLTAHSFRHRPGHYDILIGKS